MTEGETLEFAAPSEKEREISPESEEMASYLESSELRGRMRESFFCFVREQPSLKDVVEGDYAWDSMGREYDRVLIEDTERGGDFQKLIETYGKTTQPLNKSALEYRILKRIINGEFRRRLRGLGGPSSEAGRNLKVGIQEIFEDFFAPIKNYAVKVKELQTLEARRGELIAKLKVLEVSRVPKKSIQETPTDIQRQLSELKKRLSLLEQTREARVLVYFLPGFQKEFGLWQEDQRNKNQDDSLDRFVGENGEALLNTVYGKLLKKQAERRKKDHYDGHYVEGKDPIELLLEDEKEPQG